MPCPVLTVCMDARPGAFDGSHQQRVLVPTDFSEASRVALEYAECVAHRFKGHLYLLHVDSESPDSPVMKVDEAKFKELARGMKESSLIAECMTCIGSPAERIVAAAAEKNVDLIVMRVHEGDQPEGRRLHGVVYDVIRLAKCPVFTLFVR
jgi:universal stress protein A